MRDLETSVRWFESNLDVHLLKRGMAPGGRAGNAVLVGNGLCVELMFFLDSSAHQPERKRDGSLSPGITKAGAMVSAKMFDHLWNRLQKNGAQFRGGLFEDKEMRMRTFIVLENEGNMIQFFSALGTTAEK